MIQPEEALLAEKNIKRIERQATPEERERHATIRQAIEQEFPSAEGAGRAPSPPGVPSRIREARESRGLTWHALAKLAGVPNSVVIRDIESGSDVPLSAVQAVAGALGLRLELVEERV